MTAPVQGLRLSPQQRRLWAIQGESPHFRSRAAVFVSGELTPEALLEAWTGVVARHEILRTTFQRAPGIKWPVQVIAEETSVEVASLPVCLTSLSPREHVLLVDLPALSADRAAIESLLRDLCSSCALDGEGTAEPLQYGDLSQWLNDLLEEDETKPGRAYWEKLDLAAMANPRLPGARRPARGAGFTPRSLGMRIASEVTARIDAWSAAHEVPRPAFLLAAWCVLLGRLTSQPELVVGVGSDGRKYAELAGAVGLLARFLPLSCRFQVGDRFGEVARRIEEARREALLWQEAFDLDPDEPGGRWPFGFEYDEAAPPYRAGRLSFSIVRLSVCLEAFVARLVCVRDGEDLLAELHYDASVLDPGEAQRLAERFQTLLASAAANPEAEVSDLDILGGAERDLLTALGDTGVPYPEGSTVYDLFAVAVAREPWRVAIARGETELTYGDLDARAGRLARRLRALGVGPESRVGICLERSPEMVVALLAVLRAGGAYVPLDPAYPRERLGFMIEDAGLAVLLTREALAANLPTGRARVLCLDGEMDGEGEEAVLESGAGPENLAYVIYTSGSTGRPKGVMVPHRGVVHYLSWCLRAYGLAAGETVPVHSSLSFDLTVTALLAPLVAGARVELLPESAGVEALAAAFRRGSRLGLVKLTPAHLQALEQLIPKTEAAGRCRALVVGGESLLAEHLAFWRAQAPGTRLINEYGPTETVVGCCTYEIPPGGAPRTESGGVPIGRAIQNTRLHLLDARLRPVPLGVAGEIYVGGAGVARGYLGQPERTAAVFVPAPWSERPGGRLYRTGDLARHLPAGDLEFLGRRDDQVKVRGYRIELGEIESALLRHPEIAEAAVLAREDEPGDRRLVAYVVGRAGEAPAPGELLRHLGQRLPDSMLPAAFVPLPALPWTANGKVDRRALPAPEREAAAAGGHVAPRNPAEEVLAGIWAAVLGRERIGIHDDFFALGGHSLLASQVVARVREAFAVELPLRALFEARTLAGLAARLAPGDLARAAVPPLVPVPRDGGLPLSFAQQRLWFLDQWEPGDPSYNVPAAVRLEGELDAAALGRALAEIVRRHEVLRTTFEAVEGEPRQVIREEMAIPLPRIDLSCLPALPEGIREETLERLAREEAWTPFDLARGPHLRARLFGLGPGDHLLTLTLHHIVSDGGSTAVLIHEIRSLYGAFAAGLPSPLPELKVQYADFAAWQRRWLAGEVMERQLAYWRRRLAGLPALVLPADRLPGPSGRHRGSARERFSIPEDLRRPLRGLAQREGSTLAMAILAVFQVVLHQASGQADFAVGLDIANRDHPDLEPLVGFFLNQLVLRLDLSGDPGFRELLGRVRHAMLAAYENRDLPFDLLVAELTPERERSRAPLFEVKVAYQSAPLLPGGMPGLAVTPLELAGGEPKFALTLFLDDTGERVEGALEYDAARFRPGTIIRWVEGFMEVLRRILAEPDVSLRELSARLAEMDREQRSREGDRLAESGLRRLAKLKEASARANAVEMGG
ncbi:MAG: hypothetical protein QOJ16_3494 [Acidobacteriota bacterium]|nr:hypothetical protein [Acidobacteriota bacterium]